MSRNSNQPFRGSISAFLVDSRIALRAALTRTFLSMLGILLALGSVGEARAQGVTLADSHWGTSGAGADLTGRIVRPVMLDTYLPLTPTDGVDGWVQIDQACTLSDLQEVFSDGVDKRIYQFPASCEIVITQTFGPLFSMNVASDRVILRGASDTDRLKITVDLAATEPPVGLFQSELFVVGNNNPTPIATWTWSGNYAKGSQVISVPAATDVYEGDIIRLRVDSWTDLSDDLHKQVRVLCARWSNTNHGTDCTGVTSNGDIRIDRELHLDFETSGAGDPDYYFGGFTGHEVDHMERIGGGTTTDNVPEFIGMEFVDVEHTNTLGIDTSKQMMGWQGCFECWATHWSATAWGMSWGDIGASGFSNNGRLLIAHSDFEGPLFSSQCSIVVTAISADEPALVTGDGSTGAACDTNFDPITRPAIGFPSDFYEPNLAGKVFEVDCDDPNADCTLNSFVLPIYDAQGGAAVDGSTLNTTVDTAHNVAVQLSNYSAGAFYISAENSETQLVNNSFHNYRVGPLMQANNNEPVLFGNYFTTDNDQHLSRCIFNHGATEAGAVIERNDCDGGITSYATAAQGDGIGPYYTYLFNRGRGRTGSTWSWGDQCPNGGLCVEQGSGQNPYSSDQNNMIGNFWESLVGHAGGIDSYSGGAPGRFQNLEFSRNIVWGETLVDDFDASNTTTNKPDHLEGDDVDSAADAGWGSTVWPTSLAYDRQIEADPAFVPSWWCQESGPFHAGMGAPADDHNGGSPTYSKLPAQIRFDQETCTPVIDDDNDGVWSLNDNCTDVANAAQRDDDQDGYGNICDSDVTQDCIIGGPDTSAVWGRLFSAAPWSPPEEGAYDVTEDDIVGGPDVSKVSGEWFDPPGPTGRSCADCTATPGTGVCP